MRPGGMQVCLRPITAGWLNEVETSFGILSRQAIRPGSLGSVGELIAMIDTFNAD